VKTRQPPPLPAYLAVVDLDHDDVQDPDNSPLLPGGDRLVEKLQAILELHRGEIELPPRSLGKGRPNPEFAQFLKAHRHPLSGPMSYLSHGTEYIFSRDIVEQIVCTFRMQFEPQLEALMRPCFITDTTEPGLPVTVFNKDVFRASVNPEHMEFYSAFMMTTMFQQYLDGLMDANVKEIETVSQSCSGPNSPSLSQFPSDEYLPCHYPEFNTY
jgi:hypothetical protein